MALDRLSKLLAPAGFATALLALSAFALFQVVVGSATISEAARSVSFFLPTTCALGAIIALLLALIALFVRQSGEFGVLGVVGFVTAVVGTVLGAGGYWTYVFVLPELAQRPPGMADQSTGSVLAGFFLSFLVMGAGWLVFAVATLRSRVFPRWTAILLMVGSAATVVPMPSRTLLLSLAVACLGYCSLRQSRQSFLSMSDR